MPPFSNMLRTKRGRKSSRPRTPPSPGSFCSPPVAVSPALWNLERASSEMGAGSDVASGSWGRRAVPPSAWTEKSLPRPPPPPRSTSKEGLQLDLGEGPSHTRRPLGANTLLPRGAPHVPSPSLVPLSELDPVSGSKSATEIARRVPSPIKIPRAHVHAPNVTIQQSPSPSPPASNSTGDSCSEGVPELMTVLRAERASASMLGFSLRVESMHRLSACGSVRMDSATLPVEDLASATESPARPATVYAIHRISEVPSPGSLLPSDLTFARPTSEYVPPSSSFPSSPRQRSQTITGERVTGRELYNGAGRQRSASATSPGLHDIKRSRSPSGATATTHASRPSTPPDAHPIPTRSKHVTSSANSVVPIGFSSASSCQLLPSSSSSLDSPVLRSTRLASAPNPMTTLPPMLSKFTRPPLGFENFSFLGNRGRSGSTTATASATGSTSELNEVPTRPARPPSLSLRDEPPRLVHSNSGSSIGSVGLGLRRKRSSPLERKGSDAGVISIPTIHRAESSAGSHRTAGTQQPTPTSPSPAILTLKQRRETVFPTTPRSSTHEDSPTARSVPDLPGFVVDGNTLMPLKSPAPSTRKAHLPIGPKSVPVVPTRSEPVIPKTRSKPAVFKQPPSPTFEPVPVRWRGLTMDAAKWTFSSNQLHHIVSRAIKQSAETSCVRLLPLNVLDQELPVEVERLEQLRDVLQTKYKAQVRRRRLLMRSLALYIDGHDPPTSKRLLDELEDVGVVCDQLAEDLYLVGDQLGQIARLRDVHHTSALAVALRKINQSYIRARSEVVELQAERTSLEAERDEAWLMAESLERELVESKPPEITPPSSDESRVSAARRSSVRQSKLSLRRSLRRSARSSTQSGNSMRYHSIIFPRPPTTTVSSFVDLAPPRPDTNNELVPPVPPVTNKHLGSYEPSRPESSSVLPSGMYALSPATPSAASHDLYVAQDELLKMLGLSYKEYGFKLRPRSYSDCESSVPASPEAKLTRPTSSRGGKLLLRSTSDQALRRPNSAVERVITVEGILEDPAAILAALTLPQD
ncbi:hypothetical protein RSOL_392380 [Rhizoctonia solani AG-3 Rhs1AP]|uniref:Uncharacterized protein n=1 Tax=Rhizoctonia solani AG-3 Rhs1AP TaxID=1086054 RepID=X8JCB1_9AGAM|nr:hypothetical protein RSOL_392380 [Rhizoctonia solani AG-3 Rhs1AP]